MPNLSFTTSGATPFSLPASTPGGTQTTTPMMGTPAAKALSIAQYAPPNSSPTPSPTTPVKSTTVNLPDGSSHVTTFHAPDKPEATTKSSSTPTFPGILGSLAGSSEKGSATAPGYIQNTADYGKGSIDAGKKASAIAAEYGKKIADVGGQGARFEAGQLTTGTSPVAEGNAAITAQTTAAQQAALAEGEAAALQGTTQELTGQNQAANAANQAAGQAQTGQGLVQSGLGTAGGLAQPVIGGIGQVPFNPADASQGAPLGSTQPGGIESAGNLLGRFQGAQTAGAASGTVQAGQTQQIADYKSAQQQGQKLASQLTDLIQTFGLNPNDINAANAGIQAIAKNTSSAQYKILSNYLADVAARYAQILTPPGGAATDTTRNIAASMLDATASGKSIQDVLTSLDQQASAVIAGVPATGTVPGTTQGSGNTSGSGNVSAGGYNFVFQNGKWVPQ